MAWVKIDDRFPEHPKVLALGDDYEHGITLYLRGLCYAASNLTDGFVPSRFVRADGDTAERLVEVGLWRIADGGFVIHDYLQYQPSKTDAARRREKVRKVRSEAGRAGAAARWGDEILPSVLPCGPTSEEPLVDNGKMANGMANAQQTNGPVPVPVRDNPTRSVAAASIGVGGGGDSLFEEAWTAYPVHRYKEQARTAFDEAVASGSDPARIVKACKRVPRDHRQTLRFFIVDDTWLDHAPRVKRPKCPICEGLGFVLTDDDKARPCECQRA